MDQVVNGVGEMGVGREVGLVRCGREKGCTVGSAENM